MSRDMHADARAHALPITLSRSEREAVHEPLFLYAREHGDGRDHAASRECRGVHCRRHEPRGPVARRRVESGCAGAHQRLPLKQIEATQSGGLKIGALVTNSAAAYNVTVAERYLPAAAVLRL